MAGPNDPGGVSIPPPAPPPPPEEERRRIDPTLLWLLGGAAAIVVAFFAFNGGSSDTTTTTTTTTIAAATTTLGPGEAPGEVFLEVAGEIGPSAFTLRSGERPVVPTTAPLVTTTTTSSTTTSSTTTSSTTTSSTTTGATTTTTSPPPVAVPSRSGSEPGLYGGTQDQSRCDKEGIVSFLEANPDKAAAWVAAQNSDPNPFWGDGQTTLTVEDLRAYFDELTPVTLLQDTRVTNHGYRDGMPTPRQSVLEAGTAVLVDRLGVPRSRCACGNPLIPPTPVSGPPEYTGTQWPGFDASQVIVVVAAPNPITEIVITDLMKGTPIVRLIGSDGDQDVPVTTTTTTSTTLTIPPDITVGTGDVQVTLIWATDDDMDLHVIDPDGTEIAWDNRSSPSGGELDVDDIPSSGDTSTHVENIFWPEGGAPTGTYTAFVHHFSGTGTGAYTLEVRVGGVVVHSESGTVPEGAESTSVDFVVE